MNLEDVLALVFIGDLHVSTDKLDRTWSVFLVHCRKDRSSVVHQSDLRQVHRLLKNPQDLDIRVALPHGAVRLLHSFELSYRLVSA